MWFLLHFNQIRSTILYLIVILVLGILRVISAWNLIAYITCFISFFFYYSFCMEDLRGLKLTHKEHSIDFDLMMILLIKMSITKQSYHHFNCVYVYRRSETLVIFVYFSFCVANMETSIFLCIYNLNVVFFLLPNEIYLKLLDIYVFSFHSRLFERKFVFFSSLKGVCNESVKLFKWICFFFWIEKKNVNIVLMIVSFIHYISFNRNWNRWFYNCIRHFEWFVQFVWIAFA